MAINIQTREDENNRSIVRPAAQVGKLTLRPLSLGSLELLRQIGNGLATGGAALDNLEAHTLTEYIWAHAAPLQDVLETVYNHPEQAARKVAEFAMDISPADLKGIAAAASSAPNHSLRNPSGCVPGPAGVGFPLRGRPPCPRAARETCKAWPCRQGG